MPMPRPPPVISVVFPARERVVLIVSIVMYGEVLGPGGAGAGANGPGGSVRRDPELAP